jgi:hypothetical protein
MNAPDNPAQGTGDESFASIDEAMGSWQEPEEQDQQEEAADNQAPEEEAETPDAGEQDAGEDSTEIDGQTEDDPEPGPDEYSGGRFAAHNAQVKLPDGRVTTVADLVGGSMMLGDYRTKTAEVAREREAVTTERSTLKSRETELDLQTQVLMALADKVAPKRPDPNLIGTEISVEDFVQQKAAADEFERGLQQLSAYLADGQKKAKQEAEAASKAEWDKHKARLVERDKRFADKKWRDTVFYAQAARYADHYGYTSEEFGQMRDHRHFMMARDAFAYRDLLAKNKQKPAPQGNGQQRPVLTGSRRPANAQQANLEAAKARFNKNPTIHNAMDLIK